MASRYYTASKTRDKGRERYSVIFRHPVRIDTATGRPGRRVRRGLGTNDEAEADQLVAQVNELLANEEYWSVTARATAAGRFDPRVVSAFFEGMEPASAAPSATRRERYIPLPSADQDYRRVLLLGTTGAGKTTVVRQLLGTDPKTDRFPSTSTAKTTIADTEIVVADGPYRAVVTFYPRDEVVEHVVDCASKAASRSLQGMNDEALRAVLLDHENQRFRFSYVLGRQRQAKTVSRIFGDIGGDDRDGPADEFATQPGRLAGIDLAASAALVDTALGTLRALAREHEGKARAQLPADGGEDERIVSEIVDDELDKILRGDERFNAVVDSLIDEIEARFDAVTPGTITRDQQGWPSTWTWESADRTEFLRAVNRFSSNYAPLFGHLLSPLVDGIRVAGPFEPKWLRSPAPKLVLIDGEGLGHTPKSAASLPTTVAKAIDDVDAVLLVDNATQPAQAAPASAIRSILTSGNTDKLIFCFTHFDLVTGDNLRDIEDSARHVLASVDNLLSAIRNEFGLRSEQALRRRLNTARFFLADIDKPLSSDAPSGRLSIAQLTDMLAAIDTITERPETVPARPVYDKTNLVLAITAAVRSFHRRWWAILGITTEADVDKEHWSRVKALNRRFAEGTADQYDTLRPSSDLRELLKEDIYKSLEAPLRWTAEAPTEHEKTTAVINEFAQAIAKRLPGPIRERLSVRPQRSWQDAYALAGSGSTFVRARRISDEVLARNVPVPGATPSPDQNDFLHAIIGAVEEAADEVGIVLT